MAEQTPRPIREQVDHALGRADVILPIVSGGALAILSAEVRALRAERDAALALAAEWEKEAKADLSRQKLTGNKIWEMHGEQRAHAAELREALGATVAERVQS